MSVARYMNPEAILFLSTINRDETLRKMVDKLYEKQLISDPEKLYTAIIEREKIVSTGIGMGIAIPHAKLHDFNQFFISVAILSNPVDWNSLDGAPVRIVIMVCGPDDKQTEYLQVLSNITQVLKSEEKRKLLLKESDPQALIELFNLI